VLVDRWAAGVKQLFRLAPTAHTRRVTIAVGSHDHGQRSLRPGFRRAKRRGASSRSSDLLRPQSHSEKAQHLKQALRVQPGFSVFDFADVPPAHAEIFGEFLLRETMILSDAGQETAKVFGRMDSRPCLRHDVLRSSVESSHAARVRIS
jgi:hypothetical protein